jgi:methionyl-tRNA synthetase
VGEPVLVCLAWPYANGSLHLGHVAGVYLPGDIFARFQRLRGNDVLMVSGSDCHGTPITVRAEQEGRSPRDVAEQFHQEFLETWRQLGVSFDLYTSTMTENHRRVVHDIFLRLLDRGHLFRDTMLAPYCELERRFLPDRYVVGTCPHCGFGDARGDQCDNCGRPLSATELREPRCRFDGSTPVIRETEHFFLDLRHFNAPLLEWVRRQGHWRPNVLNFTLGLLEQGLLPRPITRDLEWGVTVPVEGFENKRIYVWFEAVIGYLSASMEWAQRQGDPEAWRRWWQGEGRSYYFIGKDNIPFHTIIWPAMLMGYGGLNLPYDVPANEYLTLEGRSFSTSRNWALWVPEFLKQYDPDPLRYALAVNMPETSDADFSMREFVRRNNDELVATWGNLVHRTLTFLQRYFDGRAPEGSSEPAVVEHLEDTFQRVADHLEHCRFKDGIREVMALAQEGNRYFDERAPWRQVKEDRAAAATTMATLLHLINGLKVLTYPYLPFSATRLHGLLGYADDLLAHGWRAERVPVGQALPQPTPLFTKLDVGTAA